MRRSRLIKALSVLLPAGALGASVALASAPTNTLGGSKPDASAHLTSGQSVAARLQEIRNGVSAFDYQVAAEANSDPKLLLARWLNGGGWNRRRFGWPNHGWHGGPRGRNNWFNGRPTGPWHNWWNNW